MVARVVTADDVIAEIAFWVAPHAVHVVRPPLCVVVFDKQPWALNPVVVPLSVIVNL